MTKKRRNLFLVAGLVALVAVGAAVAVGIALGGDEDHKPRYPGRIAVRDGCGLVHFFQDSSDQRTLCLTGIWDAVSLSWNGKKLAWDTGAAGLRIADEIGENEYTLSVPQGANFGPSLSPDGKRVAFLHSARDDGRYDIWVGDVDANNAEQITNTRNVTDVVWSPKGDWLAYVHDWSDETLEGQISLVRPDGDGDKTLVGGDTPEWAPDGKHLVYVHNRSIWTVGSDGQDAKRIIPNGHSPAWSRDGDQIAFMRAERCAEPPCEEHVFLAFTDGQAVRQIGPAFPEERAVLWLRDPFE
jgi:Tol biopolymer transport system component